MLYVDRGVMRDAMNKRPSEVRKQDPRYVVGSCLMSEVARNPDTVTFRLVLRWDGAEKAWSSSINTAVDVVPQPDDHSHNPRERLLLVQGTGQDALTDQDVKYQDIVYFKNDGTVDVNDVPIDFIGAMREMEMLPAGKDAYIGFTNRRTSDFVQFLRPGRDDWYADVPIDRGREWKGYYWGARTDSKGVADLLRLFFEESSWFGALNFTMRRSKHRR